MLHVLDGDATVPAFEAAGLPGRAVVWREALLEGPWPRPLRDVDEALHAVREAEATGEEVVLWFDEDLFCRVNAAYLADAFPEARFTNALGGHAGGESMRALFARRAPPDPLLGDAWRAYAAADPRALVPLAARVPWLRLHLARFPHARDGLNALERRALEVLRDEGPLPLERLRPRLARGEFAVTSYGLTDRETVRMVKELAPLVEEGPDGWSLARPGAEVLAGSADRVALAGLDRWLGGVHLVPGRLWRWDGTRLVPEQ